MEISGEKLICGWGGGGGGGSCTRENILFCFEASALSAFFKGYSGHYGVRYIVSATGIAIYMASRVIAVR